MAGIPEREVLQREFVKTCNKDEDRALKDIAKKVKDYSDDMIDKWNKEIDNLLVYAGLFSSVLTGFNVQSYLLLQPTAPDPILLVLQQISLQLNSFSVNPSGALVNSTHPVQIPAAHASPIDSWAVWLNSLWFSALICSLSSATIGILVKQWVHTLKYETGISGDSLEFARLRQYRLNHWKKWHVAEIIAILPTLLQISLLLFFSGILILLWHYHSTVAYVASILIGAITFFVVGTTIMPIFWVDCCYLSPPVYPLFTLVQRAKANLYTYLRRILECIRLLCVHLEDVMNLPGRARYSAVVALREWASAQQLNIAIYQSPIILQMHEREQKIIQKETTELHISMLNYAYATTVDATDLSDNAWVILSHKLVTPSLRDKFYREIKKVNKHHFAVPFSPQSTPPDICAGELVFSTGADLEDAIGYLFTEWSSYGDRLNYTTCRRLLLALAVIVATPNPSYNMYTKSLSILERLFKSDSNPDLIKNMSWDAVCYVALAVKVMPYTASRRFPDEQLRLLSPPSSEQAGYDWVIVSQWLGILARCCFTQTKTKEKEKERSPEQLEILMNCLSTVVGLLLPEPQEKARLITFWEDIFSFGQSALETVPWKWLEPNKDNLLGSILEAPKVGNKPTDLDFRSLQILIRCSGQVTSWTQSQSSEDVATLEKCIFQNYILTKDALSYTAQTLEEWSTPQVLFDTLHSVLEYMKTNERLAQTDDWRRLVEAIQHLIQLGRQRGMAAATSTMEADAARVVPAAATATEEQVEGEAVAGSALVPSNTPLAATTAKEQVAKPAEAIWCSLHSKLDKLEKHLQEVRGLKVHSSRMG